MWLKYQLCHAHGYGAAEYVEVNDVFGAEEMKCEIRVNEADGIREPRWELLDELPIDVLRSKVNYAQRQVAADIARLDSLGEQLAKRETPLLTFAHEVALGTFTSDELRPAALRAIKASRQLPRAF